MGVGKGLEVAFVVLFLEKLSTIEMGVIMT